MKQIAKSLGTILGLILVSNLSYAQTGKLDPVPEAPRPEAGEAQGLSRQAGVGGETSYARAGVLELGGNAGFAFADNVTQLSIAPTVGYFIMDNWQLTGILRWDRTKVDGQDASNIFSLLVEPSFHYPFTNMDFVFLGVGVGMAKSTGDNLGLAVAPRIGYKRLIGRSGMLTTDLSSTYYADEVESSGGVTSFSLSNRVAIGVGYTVLW